MICKYILLITFLNDPELILRTLLKSFKYCYFKPIIQFKISHSFA